MEILTTLLLIECRLLLLSPDTEALSTFDAFPLELLVSVLLLIVVITLCVLDNRFSFSASDRNGLFGVN